MAKHYAFLTTAVLSALFIGLWSLLHPPIQKKLNGYLAAGERYLSTGTYDSAFRAFSKAVALDGTNQQAKRGLTLARINYFTHFEPYEAHIVSSRIEEISESVGNVPNIALFKGDKALFFDHLTLAARYYEDAARSSPDLVQAVFARGVIDLKLGDRRNAHSRLRQAILKAPRKQCYKLTLAEALVDAGHGAEALDVYHSTISEGPYHSPAYVGLATLSLALGLYEEAHSYIEVLTNRLHAIRNSRLSKKNRRWTVGYLKNRTLDTYDEKTVYVNLLRLLAGILSGNTPIENSTSPPAGTDLPDRVLTKLSDDVLTIIKLSPSSQSTIERFAELVGYPYIDWVHGNLRDGYVYCGGIYH